MGLVEVVVGVVLTGLLTAGLLQASIIGLRTLDNTNKRIAGSNDTQLIAGYFTSDVASAEFVSTTGTRTHKAPSVTPQAANSVYAGFWTVQRNTTMTAPDSMLESFQVSTPRLTIQSADEQIDDTTATGDRVTTSTVGSSSINHAVSLRRSGTALVARNGTSSASTTSDNGLTLPKPTSSIANDFLLAQLAVVGGSGTSINAPAGWTLLEVRDSGLTVKSLLYSHRVIAGDPPSWSWSFTPQREAVGAIVGYSGVSTSAIGDPARNSEISPCGGETPALLLSWTDRGTNVVNAVAYVGRTVNGENRLVRRRCIGNTGSPSSETTLASDLAPASIHASCSKPIVCGPLPVVVTMTLSEAPAARETNGRSYQLRAATRTTAS